MPPWMPSNAVGVTFLVAGALMIASAFSRRMIVPGKVGMILSMVTSVAMATGLFIGYPTVTASLDRPMLYLAFALAHYPALREPPSNPLTETR